VIPARPGSDRPEYIPASSHLSVDAAAPAKVLGSARTGGRVGAMRVFDLNDVHFPWVLASGIVIFPDLVKSGKWAVYVLDKGCVIP
jgi:hypothetical protein